MNQFVVFLRGINVGGHKKIPMAELRDFLITMGFKNVKTYIQSGNLFLYASENERSKIEQSIHEGILSHFGFDVPVLARTPGELKRIFQACPFSEEKKEKSYFIMLSDIPKKENVAQVNTISFENEEFIILNDCIYFYSSIGYGRTKFNMKSFENKLSVKATSRNYRTMVKLLSLSEN